MNDFIAERKDGTFRIVSYSSKRSAIPRISAHDEDGNPLIFHSPHQAHAYLVNNKRARPLSNSTQDPYYIKYERKE
jgi:hypothetical protein